MQLVNIDKNKTDYLLSLIRGGKPMTASQQAALVLRLSGPAVMAQLSSIIMQYIDATMVGSLGANASASIGLVSTTTWLFGGLISAVSVGFSVQVAHSIGAGDFVKARAILRQSLISVGVFGIVAAVIGIAISGHLPYWLGGDAAICADSSAYFLIYASFLPLFQMYVLSGGMLRSSGNMRIPSILSVLMCLLDVVFNFFLIFPTREINISGASLTMPGAGLGVEGAAWGTGLAELVVAVFLLTYLCTRSKDLKLVGERGSFMPTAKTLRNALKISLPMGIERAVMCGAQIMSTVIVAPLGIVAIAANSFAITAESLCYMPGYGVADAATTLVGQSYGAGRKDLTERFATITVSLGMAVMGLMGVVLYFGAPYIMSTLTPVEEILTLGADVLRIEAFAEPMFAAAIVCYGVFVGMGNTLVPSLMNFFSMWSVRLTLAASLAPMMGLRGVWLAMCIELCFRGVIFLIRLVMVLRKERYGNPGN